jgi:hypothetical protein
MAVLAEMALARITHPSTEVVMSNSKCFKPSTTLATVPLQCYAVDR